MTEYKFTLYYRAPVIDDLDEYVDSLVDHGCEDALIAIEETGLVVLMFERAAISAEEAISSAQSDVLNAIPAGVFVEAAPDSCGLSDIAAHVGVSRQYIRKVWTKREGNGFPEPISHGKSPTWSLASVLKWLQTTLTKKQDRNLNTLYEVALINRSLNIEKQRSDLITMTPFSGGGVQLSELEPSPEPVVVGGYKPIMTSHEYDDESFWAGPGIFSRGHAQASLQ